MTTEPEGQLWIVGCPRCGGPPKASASPVASHGSSDAWPAECVRCGELIPGLWFDKDYIYLVEDSAGEGGRLPGRSCPDGGKCWHDCDKACWRVFNAAPLTAAGYTSGRWPQSIKEQELALLTTIDKRFREYGEERLEQALDALRGDGADLEVLGEIELALMSLSMYYGDLGPITLTPSEVVEYVDAPEPECICPAGLVARGGFRSGCPVHG